MTVRPFFIALVLLSSLHAFAQQNQSSSGDKGDIWIKRVGDKLVETWANGEVIELFPGKYDTFFSREDGWVERFLRDKSGKVSGILYTHTDGEFEAKRLP